MDEKTVERIGLAIDGLEFKLLDDGTMGFRPYIHAFAQEVAHHVSKQFDDRAYKDQCDLIALRSKVAAQASEILRLRTNASNAIDCLNEESEDD